MSSARSGAVVPGRPGWPWALPGLDVVALDERLGRAAGELMRSAATADVVDAALIALSVDGDVVYTSDVGDLEHLAAVGGVEIQIVRV